MQKVTTSMLLWNAQLEMFQAFARKHNMNTSECFREIVIPWVAEQLGRSVPRVPKLERRSSNPPRHSTSPSPSDDYHFPPIEPRPTSDAPNGHDVDAIVGKVLERLAALSTDIAVAAANRRK